MNDTFQILKFRDIFIDTEITHSGKESHTWLAGPNTKYWSQQVQVQQLNN